VSVLLFSITILIVVTVVVAVIIIIIFIIVIVSLSLSLSLSLSMMMMDDYYFSMTSLATAIRHFGSKENILTECLCVGLDRPVSGDLVSVGIGERCLAIATVSWVDSQVKYNIVSMSPLAVCNGDYITHLEDSFYLEKRSQRTCFWHAAPIASQFGQLWNTTLRDNTSTGYGATIYSTKKK